MKKVEDAKKSLEQKRWFVRCNKNALEESKKRTIEKENVKNESLKRFKQLSYEYHPVASKLSLDDDVEARGKLVGEAQPLSQIILPKCY